MSDPSAGNTESPAQVTHTYEIQRDHPCGVAIVSAMAQTLNTDPLELPELLYTAVNVDALNALFDPDADVAPMTSDPVFSFRYCGHRVEITPDELTLTPAEDAE